MAQTKYSINSIPKHRKEVKPSVSQQYDTNSDTFDSEFTNLLRQVTAKVERTAFPSGLHYGTDCITERTALPSGLHYLADCITQRTALRSVSHYLSDCITERTALSSGLHYRADCITERTALSSGLHYRATSAERFCILKIIYKENSEIFCWADPINRV